MNDSNPQPRVCPRCQVRNPGGANFCARCGESLDARAIRSVTPVVPIMQRWRDLSHKLTRKDVRKLLGEPLRIEPPLQPGDAAVERWHYEYEIRASHTRVRGTIDVLVSEGRIVTWTEPDWMAFGH